MPKKDDKSFDLMANIGKKTESQTEGTVKDGETEKAKPSGSRKSLPYYPPSDAVHRQLKRLAFEEETSMNSLINEGLDIVFKKRGLKSIRELLDT